MLKFISETFNIPVLVTNQITVSTIAAAPPPKEKVDPEEMEDQKEEGNEHSTRLEVFLSVTRVSFFSHRATSCARRDSCTWSHLGTLC
jgi:hypothetical protein